MIGAIAKILQAGAKYALKKKGKGVAKDYASKSAKMKPAKKAKDTAKTTMPGTKMLSKGAAKSKKPGMSPGYKLRVKLNKELSNTKRQMAKQGHSKELSQKIGNLQKQIDLSYKQDNGTIKSNATFKINSNVRVEEMGR